MPAYAALAPKCSPAMSFSCRRRRRAAAIAITLAVWAAGWSAGCSWQTPTTIAPPSPQPPVDAPHVITSLSQLSPNDTDSAELNTAAKVLKSTTAHKPSAQAAESVGEDRPSVLRRLYLEDPTSPRYAPTAIPHTEIRLLNAKAAQYPDLANLLLTQLITEMVQDEKVPPLSKLELSEDPQPVIVTAILDDRGQLKELIYRQHSGLAAIDNFVISACKASLWANNVPQGALAADGNYRLRIEAQLSKYSTDREGNQTFITRLGLGIM